MGNSYCLWGKVLNLKTFRGVSKYQNNYCISTFTLEHYKEKQKINVKCKSYREVVSDLSLKNGQMIELTDYYPRNEKMTDANGNDVWTQWIVVDEFRNVDTEPKVEPQPIPQYEKFEPPKQEQEQPVENENDVVSLDFLYDIVNNNENPQDNVDLKAKQRQMLLKQYQAIKQQPPAPAWENVQVQDVKIDDSGENKNEW